MIWFIFRTFLLIIASASFITITHPLAMGVTIIFYTLILCFLLSLTGWAWFSYTLFLVFLGAILVLFVYIAALASNELFEFNYYFFYTVTLFIYSILWLLFLIKDVIFYINILPEFNNQVLINLYSDQNLLLTRTLILYLLLTLFVVVRVCETNSGPLRRS